MTIYILSYNSYFNRIVKKYDSLKEYGNYIIHSETQLNFNPGDGCDTTFVAGRQGNPYDGSGNYLIYSEDNVSITSRWFITEQTRTLKGQYSITLHRDVIVDSYDEVMDADMVVESAIIPDTNPLIYNAEPISVNQIKMDEQQLKDKTGCPWIVGYFDKTNGNKEYSAKITYEADEEINETYESWAEKYIQYVYPIQQSVTVPFKQANIVYGSVFMNDMGQTYYNMNPSTKSGIYSLNIDKQDDELGSKLIKTTVFTDLYKKWFGKYNNPNSKYHNKVLRFNTNKEGVYEYRKITVNTMTESVTNHYDSYSELAGSSLNTFLTNNNFGLVLSAASGYVDVTYTAYVVRKIITSEVVTTGTYKSTIKATSDRLAKDAPYGIFAIPYGNIKINDLTCDKDAGMTWVMGAYAQAGGSSNTFIYDVQLLPYCPCPEWIQDDGSIKVTSEASYSYITQYDGTGAKVADRSIMIYPQSQTFTLDIDYPINVTNKKIDSVCDMVRLCSPNFNGQFEFTPAKNDGVAYFNIDCTYLPYNPYIHINPNFGELYGKDFNDARGLICQGEFSLPVMNDNWISYLNTNKNYQNIFDRQIQNMEVNRKYQVKQEKWQRHAQMAQAFSSGTQIGKNLGFGTRGQVGGGIVATAMSAYGAHLDKEISEGLYQESVSFAKDNFNMQLDNIQAQPQSIGKTTAFTANNKIFPIVEHYSCKPEEKKFIANKIALNSMNVGIVGKPSEYVQNTWEYEGIKSKGFFKGILLHADINQDSHYLMTLAKELSLGGYFTWE